MAGERMQFAGFIGPSGVCPLSGPVISQDGQTQRFLHARAGNSAAMRLYEGPGHAIECPVNLAVVTPARAQPELRRRIP
jgi:hypothetical protein